MPSILLYEFLASGGALAVADAPDGESLCREGAAMLGALAADFAAVEGCETTVLLGPRWRGPSPTGCRIVAVEQNGGDCEALATHAARANWTVVIAPEFEGLLQARCEAVERVGGRLLGSSSRLVSLCADKQRTAEHLAAAGVAVAQGIPTGPDHPLPTDVPFSFPAVLKPRDGAGSQDVRFVADRAAAERARESLNRPGRLERFYPGRAASVAFLCGPAGRWPLPPCFQRLSSDDAFHYLGGACPIAPELAGRAARLAAAAIASLPDAVGYPVERPSDNDRVPLLACPAVELARAASTAGQASSGTHQISTVGTLGYLGVDLVLGDDPSGAGDVVIEINPRLTTSYVGLRRVVKENLAVAMLRAATGAAQTITWNGAFVAFNADGTIGGPK